MKHLRRLFTRFHSLFTRQRDEERLREEFEEHLAMLIEDKMRSGLPYAEARRQARLSFGSLEVIKETYREQRGLPRLEAVAADVVFGWRQLRKHPVTTAAAILSLALAIGATTAAFRLVDAVLWRPLPVAEPERLSYLAQTLINREGKLEQDDSFDYPTFQRYQQAVGARADFLVVGRISRRQQVRIGMAKETETLHRQYVSGNLFEVFGLRAAHGRLFRSDEDRKPGGHPVAVLSYDYWTRRFQQDPAVLGTVITLEKHALEIIGVAPQGFIGTEPGETTDLFVPATMNVEALASPGWAWFRIWIRPSPGWGLEQIEAPLQLLHKEELQQRLRSFPAGTPQAAIDRHLSNQLHLFPAASGVSDLQRQYRQPLLILALLVVLVLLVACANVANLLMAQGATRAHEMALRVSLGASRASLVRLVLIEGTMLAGAASLLGAMLASMAVPIVIAMLRLPNDPVRLASEAGWREFLFSAALTVVVSFLFGLAPALRASASQPISALKGSNNPSSNRFRNGLVATQLAFCIFVLFLAGLFVNSFAQLQHRPLGFSPDKLLVVQLEADRPRQLPVWMQLVEHLRNRPGVESASLAGWPLLTGNRWTGPIRVPGDRLAARDPNFLQVSPDYFKTMKIRRIGGRELRLGDEAPRLNEKKEPLAGVGVVNETFARTYFNGRNPVGRVIEVTQNRDQVAPLEIVGYVQDTVYADLREPFRPTIYLPMNEREESTILVRSRENPLALAPSLREELSRAFPTFRIRNSNAQEDLIQGGMLREKLLSSISLFFAFAALLLAAVGLYGILHDSVTVQRREIGIRLALGAQAADIVREVTSDAFRMLLLGCGLGMLLGLATVRYIQSLLYGVKATDFAALLVPLLLLISVATLAALTPVLRAIQLDPAKVLREESL